MSLKREIKESNLRLVYDQELDIFSLHWMAKVQSVQLRQGYEQALQMAKELETRFWLFDLRERGTATAEDEQWILNEFFPLLEETLGRRNYFAYLVLPEHYRRLRDYIGLVRLQEYSPVSKIHAFMSETDAVQWLSQCQKKYSAN